MDFVTKIFVIQDFISMQLLEEFAKCVLNFVMIVMAWKNVINVQ